METYAVIPAAGRGLRMGLSTPKQFIHFRGKPLLIHTLQIFAQAPFMSGIVLAVPAESLAGTEWFIRKHLTSAVPVTVIEGGSERQDSVYNGLRHLPDSCRWVMVHDAVRPLVTVELLRLTLKEAQKTGACIPALPVAETVKRVKDGQVVETLPREDLELVQTPQVFRKNILVRAYQKAREEGWLGTDDASLVERLGETVTVVPGEPGNIKITTPEDLRRALWVLEAGKL